MLQNKADIYIVHTNENQTKLNFMVFQAHLKRIQHMHCHTLEKQNNYELQKHIKV